MIIQAIILMKEHNIYTKKLKNWESLKINPIILTNSEKLFHHAEMRLDLSDYSDQQV